jgi:phosphoribosyl 1,2-cyclic phosphate phosphodiesterase
MRLTFLGTSAANAYPEAFCRCVNCQAARDLGGRSLRRRSAALINDDLLIDLGPDIHTASQAHGISLANVQYCLQTHAHADHLDPSHLLSRSADYGTQGTPRLHFYASSATLQRVAWMLSHDFAPGSLLDPYIQERLNVHFHAVHAFQAFDAGSYHITPFPAEHDPSIEPLLYAIQSEEQAIFYATDTAALPESTWQALAGSGLHLDLAIFDHTYGPEQPGSDHLNALQVSQYAARLRQEGLLKTQGRVLATHIAHEGNRPHCELSAFADRHGYEVAYDGLVIE